MGYSQWLSSVVLAAGKAKRKQHSGCWLKAGQACLSVLTPIRNAKHKPTQAPQILDGEWMNWNMKSSNVQCLPREKTIFKCQSLSSSISCFKDITCFKVQVQRLRCILVCSRKCSLQLLLSYIHLRNDVPHFSPFQHVEQLWCIYMDSYMLLNVHRPTW